MNKETYDRITREYSFLDDYEKEMSKKINPNQTKQHIKTNTNYSNNYYEPEKSISSEEKIENELLESKNKFNKTRYGNFVNKNLDTDKLGDADYLYNNLEIKRNSESQNEAIEESDRAAFNDAMEAIKKFEYRFYAFLNKEFNILNKKMIKCSMMCYDDPKMFTCQEAKICAEKCHQNIKEAQKFTENVQEKSRTKLQTCIENAREFKSENVSDDKVTSFFKCYDNLIEDFNSMEKEIKQEFSYYI
jgi:hypothetical protein